MLFPRLSFNPIGHRQGLYICHQAVLFVILNAALSAAVQPPTPRVTLGRGQHAPLIDAVFNDRCWEEVPCFTFSNLVAPDFSRVAQIQTVARACYNESHLYLAIRCEEPRVQGMRTEVMKRDGPVWRDDCIELFFDPGRTREQYYQIVVNSRGTVFDQMEPSSENWDSRVKVATSMLEEGWVLEVAIPWAAFETPPSVSEVWGFNLARERYAGGARELSSWSATGEDFGQPGRFGEVIFGEYPICYEIAMPVFFGFGPNYIKVSPISEMEPTVRIIRSSQGRQGGVQQSDRLPLLRKSKGWDLALRILDGTELGVVVSHGDGGNAGFVQALPFGITPKPLTLEIQQRIFSLRQKLQDGDVPYTAQTVPLLKRAEAALGRFIQSNKSRSIPMSPEEWDAAHDSQLKLRDELVGSDYVVWTKSPLDNLLPTQGPPSLEASTRILIEACVNEREAGSFVISNTEEEAFEGHFTFTGLHMTGLEVDALKSGTVFSNCVTLHEVLFHRLRNGQTVADPLPRMNEAQSFIIPAGHCREFWMEVDAKHLPPGRYKGAIEVLPFDHDTSKKTVDLLVDVKRVRLPDRMPIATYNWDYARDERYVLNLVEHRTNCFLMNTHPPIKIGKDGTEEKPTDWTAYDRLLRIKLAAAREHGGIVVFSYGLIRDFHRRYSNKYRWKFMNERWKQAFRALVLEFDRHLREDVGMAYEDYVVQLWDEAENHNVERTVAAGRLLRSIAPRMRTCMDGAQDSNEIRVMEPFVDHWIPHQKVLHDRGKHSDLYKTYNSIMGRGKPVWTYTCSRNMKAQSPLGYYRLKEWRVWDLGLQGSCYWAYNSWSGDPWNDFDGEREDCGVVYDGPDGPVNSRRWEATRDGREDYLCLHLLREASELAGNKKRREVKVFIDGLVAEVLASASDVEGFETSRSELLKKLEEVCAPSIPELIAEPVFSKRGNEVVCRLRASRPVTVQFLWRKPGDTMWHCLQSERSAEPTIHLAPPLEDSIEWFLMFYDNLGATGCLLEGLHKDNWLCFRHLHPLNMPDRP
ncbi:MAG: sugar-binding protein [Thermodesulfobacteriota bacterium]|nr:sugar-binding protein [Thermodesulfobacteriota bacterium]